MKAINWIKAKNKRKVCANTKFPKGKKYTLCAPCVFIFIYQFTITITSTNTSATTKATNYPYDTFQFRPAVFMFGFFLLFFHLFFFLFLKIRFFDWYFWCCRFFCTISHGPIFLLLLKHFHFDFFFCSLSSSSFYLSLSVESKLFFSLSFTLFSFLFVLFWALCISLLVPLKWLCVRALAGPNHVRLLILLAKKYVVAFYFAAALFLVVAFLQILSYISVSTKKCDCQTKSWCTLVLLMPPEQAKT